MKSPWDLASRGQDDMEALQTDVMRFMAILGLCLAAIFSLVKSPDFNPPTEVETEIRQGTAPESAEKLPRREVEEPSADPVQKPKSSPAQPKLEEKDSFINSKEEGFTLEFESARGLGSLVNSGRVTLVVSDNDLYWAWSAGEGLARLENPPGYHAMEERTVPDEYRLAAETELGAGQLTWGVVLPVDIIDQIDSLVEQHSGGVLVISSTGAVSLATSH